MPRNDVKGAKQFNYELPEELVDQFREFARSRGNKVVVELALALRRHMAYPPPPEEVPPLPDSPQAKKKKPKSGE